MSQTRLESFVETITNIVIGYTCAIITQLIVFPFFNIHIPFTSNLKICFIFGVIAILRLYIVRRFFNSHIYKLANCFFYHKKRKDI